ncbi:MAG: hypothetical protein HY901_03615 [Deltaproteobacteria bacterium]|nr:hypothetical protein [Deltaproteobacteria bacterium]
MRTTLAAFLALALCAGCKTAQPAGDAPERAARKAPVESAGGEDTECAKKVRADKKHYCDDAPAEVPEGYAARIRRVWDEHAHRCEGMRARAALRVFDQCVTTYEAEGNQIDLETRTRRDEAKNRVAELKADPVFQRALAKKRSAVEDADTAASEYKEAVTSRKEGTEIRFRREAWAEADAAAKAAEAELRTWFEKESLDPKDVRAFGLW